MFSYGFFFSMLIKSLVSVVKSEMVREGQNLQIVHIDHQNSLDYIILFSFKYSW